MGVHNKIQNNSQQELIVRFAQNILVLLLRAHSENWNGFKLKSSPQNNQSIAQQDNQSQIFLMLQSSFFSKFIICIFHFFNGSINLPLVRNSTSMHRRHFCNIQHLQYPMTFSKLFLIICILPIKHFKLLKKCQIVNKHYFIPILYFFKTKDRFKLLIPSFLKTVRNRRYGFLYG